MSDTNTYKTIKIPGRLCYALVRALKTRIAIMTSQKEFASKAGDYELSKSCEMLIEEATEALSLLNGTQFDTPRSEGMKP